MPGDRLTPTVAVVGGGLAGLAAASAAAQCGMRVELFEARRTLGGRAGSFRDPATGEVVDHCQHVGLGCCRSLTDFYRATGIAHLIRRDRVLRFYGPEGRCHTVRPARWLPAPLHLAPSLAGLGFLSLRQRWGIARSLLRLARGVRHAEHQDETIDAWLKAEGQSPQAIRRFWSVILVSALSESIEHVALAAARKVFVEGFLATRDACHLLVPTVSLQQVYDDHVRPNLQRRGVTFHLQTPVRQVLADRGRATGLVLSDGSERGYEFIVLAVPWNGIGNLLTGGPAELRIAAQSAAALEPVPITAVHLWLDRPISGHPHAVLVDRLAQWVFQRGPTVCPGGEGGPGHYYQVVISASRELAGMAHEEVFDRVLKDLAAIWPAAADARLLHGRLVTQRHAVFSCRPGSDALRPPQWTPLENLVLAGDWTQTGWPATMEGAVRSGYLAVEAILRARRQPCVLVVPDVRPGWLARWLF